MKIIILMCILCFDMGIFLQTLHKRVETMPLHYLECLESLPWWIVVNDLGSDSMKKRLDEAYFSVIFHYPSFL